MLSEDVNAAAQFPFLALTTALCRDNFGPLKPSAWDSTRDPEKGTAVLESDWNWKGFKQEVALRPLQY